MRYSLTNPHAYVHSNIAGFLNILEACRHHPVQHLVYASSSSVYGGNTEMPFSESRQRRPPGQPVRRHQEVQRADGAHLQPSVRHADHGPALLHRLRAVGPARHGALPLHQGHPRRRSRSTSSTTARCSATSPTSTTSSKASSRVLDRAPQPNPEFDTATPDPAHSWAPYQVLNIGNHGPAGLLDYLDALEEALERRPSGTTCQCSLAMWRRRLRIRRC